MISFTVRGLPAPQGSKTRNRYGAVYESSKAVGPWREAVRAECQRHAAEPLTGAVEVTLLFLMPRPKGHYRTGRNAGLLRAGAPSFPASAPDLDKLCRAVLDGLTAGGAYKDDGQVVYLAARKQYCGPAEVPGCMIMAEEI